MKTSRRSFGAFLMGGLFAGSGTTLATPSLARSVYPALLQLSALLPDKRACLRLADAGIAAWLDEARLASLEARTAQAFARDGGTAPAALFEALNAADFREGRTLVVGGFTLAETEAGAVLLRARAA